MKRRHFLELIGGASFGVGMACAKDIKASEKKVEENVSDQPNVVFVFCDDLGWGDVSCLNPDSKIHTPNIDRLADSGISFTDAHAGSAVCTPSRYTLLTGRYCWRTAELKDGVNSGYSPALIREGRETVASLLKRGGYHSACIGKWHVGMDWPVNSGERPPQDLGGLFNSGAESRIDFGKPIKNGPNAAGFDYYFGISASLDMTPYTWIENDRVTVEPTDISPAGRGEKRARSGACAPGWTHEAVIPALLKKSKDYIADRAKKGSPFFLYVPLTGPHTPVVPNEEWIGKSGCGIYGDFVMEIDDVVGQIVKAVSDAGLEKNTIICFSSDNGPETIVWEYKQKFGHYSAWRYRGVKRDNWEGGHRVPYIISWPGTIEAGRKVDRFVELADFTATACDLAGVEIPEGAAEDSYSMVDILKGREPSNYRKFSMHHSANGRWAIRKGQWKLLLHKGPAGNRDSENDGHPLSLEQSYRDRVVPGGLQSNYSADDPVQLYDMSTDPFEFNNLYKKHPEIVAEMKALCVKCILDGRSTPGEPQPVDAAGEWTQLTELLAMK